MRGATLCLIGLLLPACGGRTIPFFERDAKDASTHDSGFSTPRDAGPRLIRDGGFIRDGGSAAVCGNGVCEPGENSGNCRSDCRPSGPCPDGSEGCACNSSWRDGTPSFARDDCEADLECVPWDLLSGNPNLTGPVQSCVRPCSRNADCGGGRVCADVFELDEVPGFGRICVDRVTQPDDYCGGSRSTVSRLQNGRIRTPREIVGCTGDARCLIGLAEDIHPDEGVCLQLCNRPGDPPCSPPTPYCNPNILADGAGICSVGRLGVGSWCSDTEGDRPGFTTRCDTSDATPGQVFCVGLGIDRGLCMETCDTTQNPPAMPCQGVDPGGMGPLYCVDGLLQTGGGICFSPNCDNFPDTCDGPGADGFGRFCLALTQEGDGLCSDRLGPPFMPGTISSDGQLIGEGDNCQDGNDLSFARCPEGTMCLGTQMGGSCLAGCRRDAGGDMYCAGLLNQLGLPSMNGQCSEIPPFMDPAIGLCGGD